MIRIHSQYIYDYIGDFELFIEAEIGIRVLGVDA